MKSVQKLTLLSALIGGMFSAQASFAADTVCSLAYRVSGGAVITTEINASNWDNIWENVLEEELPAVTIAVASNFYSPAIDLITAFMSSTSGAGYSAIGVCHNATGHLVQEITGSNPAVITGEWLSDAIGYKYGAFLAADEVTPLGLSSTYAISPVKRYANGIPALLGNPARIPPLAADELVTATAGAPTGNLNGNPNNSGQYIMNTTNLSLVGIGHLVNAPYGIAAKAVIQAMGQWTADPTPETGNSPTDPCTANPLTPAGMPSFCEYDNISVTFDETVRFASNLDAGWVSWAQILAAPNTNSLRYVTFPDYAIGQAGVRLTNPNPSGTAAIATDVLWSFMKLDHPDCFSGAFFLDTGYSWNQWLATEGYGALDDPNPDLDNPSAPPSQTCN